MTVTPTITQADRALAADFYDACGLHLTGSSIREGGGDQDEYVIRIARHRAQEPLGAAGDGWTEKGKQWLADGAPIAAATDGEGKALADIGAERRRQITLSEYELRNIDELISVHEILGGDHYDTLWNLRNRIKPFVEGDEHFDPEFPCAGEDE